MTTIKFAIPEDGKASLKETFAKAKIKPDKKKNN